MPFNAKLAPRLIPGVGALFSPLPYQMIIAVGAGLSYMFFLNLLSLIFRHQWVAASVFIIVLTIILATVSAH
jgi:hypothetical protein